jgi:hypothetical protein
MQVDHACVVNLRGMGIQERSIVYTIDWIVCTEEDKSEATMCRHYMCYPTSKIVIFSNSITPSQLKMMSQLFYRYICICTLKMCLGIYVSRQS